MLERDSHDDQSHERFWRADREIGRFHVWGETYELYLRTHTLTLPAGAPHEIVPLAPGPRTYLRGQAYIVEPWPVVPAAVAARGLSVDALRELQRVRVGDVQAFWYPADATLIVRDCALLNQYREADPALDPNHRALWRGAEEALLDAVPTARSLVTSQVQHGYAAADYQRFLREQGFRPAGAHAVAKPVDR